MDMGQSSEIFKFDSYRSYLKLRFPVSGENRGHRARLSKHIGCQTSFISLVLSQRTHLNEDMAFLCCEFLKLTAQETQFFLLLFHYEKAGTEKLRIYYKEQMSKTLKQREDIRSRVATEKQMSIEKQMYFSSDWIFSAIIALVQIPQFREQKSIAEKLQLSETTVAPVLNWLLTNDFIKIQNDKFIPSTQRVHLNSDSQFLEQHHRNWRNESIRSLKRKNESDLHYSGAISISYKDYFKVRELILKSISDIEVILKPSADEELVGICLDLFKY